MSEREYSINEDQRRLREALLLLSWEFYDGRTPLADEAAQTAAVDELLFR